VVRDGPSQSLHVVRGRRPRGDASGTDLRRGTLGGAGPPGRAPRRRLPHPGRHPRGRHGPELHRILRAFGDLTGCPVLVNTSFNVRGEPIVQTVDDAYRCFVHTGIDWLLVDDCLLSRRDQPAWSGQEHVVAAD
jgi:hypothetical protein